MTLSSHDQQRIEELAEKLVEHYNFKRPPVPVEKILSEPPEEVSGVDISDLSLVFGVGEHRYEYRMAMARLLYREICRAGSEGEQNYPYSNDAARYFAMSLLIPAQWVIKAAWRPLITLQQLSEDFQVPDYAMSSRLVQLGKRVKGMS
ncbi:MAG TPA: hypothetical protein PLH19_03665 [Anaerolineae bacterium]|nr:hypothetical protein [Anaerolineae bacterium]HQH37619.1 hypothetical protein [Anaerolineae bacterium]